MSFSPNCNCRAVVTVLVIRPAPAMGCRVAGFSTSRNAGVAKLARLNRLKKSARNSSRLPSLIPKRVFFVRLKSKFSTPGPTRMFRPALPKKPVGGSTKTEASKYSLGFLGRTRSPKARPGMRSGRCLPGLRERSGAWRPETTAEKGVPAEAVKIPETCHPPSASRAARES